MSISRRFKGLEAGGLNEGALAGEIRRLRQGDSRYNIILLAAVSAAMAVALVLPDRSLPAMPLAALVAGWEARAWLDRRAAQLEAQLDVLRARQVMLHRLVSRPHEPAPTPDRPRRRR